eukprot:scaffold17646_cov90-Isochrysis_galbana.AAC.1
MISSLGGGGGSRGSDSAAWGIPPLPPRRRCPPCCPPWPSCVGAPPLHTPPAPAACVAHQKQAPAAHPRVIRGTGGGREDTRKRG